MDKSDYLTGDVDASAKVEARELGTAAHNHLNARVFQTDAVRQVQVLQLQVQLRPRIGAQIIGVAVPVVAAGPQRAGVDAGDLWTSWNENCVFSHPAYGRRRNF